MKKNNILITGGAGFIGSHIAHSLKSKYKKIFVIDNLKTGDENNLLPEFKFLNEDCSSFEYEKYKNDFGQIDSIIHFAGQSSAELSFKDPIYDFDTNLKSTVRLIDFANKNNVKSFIFASSVTVYTPHQSMPLKESHNANNSNSFYAITKLTSEKYIDLLCSKNLHSTILRLFNVYGSAQNLNNPDQGMLSIYLEQALNSEKILVKGSLERTRDFVHVFDVVDVVNRCLEMNHSSGQKINVCSSSPTKVSELISKILFALKKDASIINAESTRGDTFEHWGSNKLCSKLLEKETWINLDEGLKLTVDAYNSGSWFKQRIYF